MYLTFFVQRTFCIINNKKSFKNLVAMTFSFLPFVHVVGSRQKALNGKPLGRGISTRLVVRFVTERSAL